MRMQDHKSLKKDDKLESSKEDSKFHWLCNAMKKSACSLDEEKKFKT